MKLFIVLTMTAFAFGCATSKPMAPKVVVTKSGRTIAQAEVAPGKKLNFYSCKVGVFSGSKPFDKSKCELVSDVNIGTVLSNTTDAKNTIASLEKISVKEPYNGGESRWTECDGEDQNCINSGDTWDWETTSFFHFNDAQREELNPVLKQAYANNKGISVYFSKVKMEINGMQSPMHSFDLRKAKLQIEPN